MVSPLRKAGGSLPPPSTTAVYEVPNMPEVVVPAEAAL